MVKVDWLAACGIQREGAWLALYWSTSPELATSLQIIPANKNRNLASDEISQTLLTNEKQGKVN
jgi:hypothetical protein